MPQPRPHQPQPDLAGWPLHAALPLGALSTAPGCGRAWTRQVLREWGQDRLADDTELLVSELTTNAVQASAPLAGAAIGLWLASDCERAVILVWDPSPQPPPASPPARESRQPASQVPSPRRTVDDMAASPGLAGSSSVVMPKSSFMAAS